jgi:hypothetical protein
VGGIEGMADVVYRGDFIADSFGADTCFLMEGGVRVACHRCKGEACGILKGAYRCRGRWSRTSGR